MPNDDLMIHKIPPPQGGMPYEVPPITPAPAPGVPGVPNGELFLPMTGMPNIDPRILGILQERIGGLGAGSQITPAPAPGAPGAPPVPQFDINRLRELFANARGGLRPRM